MIELLEKYCRFCESKFDLKKFVGRGSSKVDWATTFWKNAGRRKVKEYYDSLDRGEIKPYDTIEIDGENIEFKYWVEGLLRIYLNNHADEGELEAIVMGVDDALLKPKLSLFETLKYKVAKELLGLKS